MSCQRCIKSVNFQSLAGGGRESKKGRGRDFDVLQNVLKHLPNSASPSLVAIWNLYWLGFVVYSGPHNIATPGRTDRQTVPRSAGRESLELPAKAFQLRFLLIEATNNKTLVLLHPSRPRTLVLSCLYHYMIRSISVSVWLQKRSNALNDFNKTLNTGLRTLNLGRVRWCA